MLQFAVCLTSLFLIAISPARAGDELQVLENCTYIETDWGDGDSFLVQDANGKQFTIRLYGVDCIECHVNDETDARRLRAQRRYFGISQLHASTTNSIEAARKRGEEARAVVQRELAAPFKVITAFADARGDGKHNRYYAFVTTSKNEDLSEMLVRLGLARAFGVCRETIDGRARDEYRDWLKDIELQAAKRGIGIWADTDWELLPAERREERREEEELQLAMKKPSLPSTFKINPNAAARDELMRLPGIGEELANRIIENRPYRNIESITDVPGIGPKKLKELRPYLTLDQ
jgi:DNA uptake protein ComE-like DNA-binding protein